MRPTQARAIIGSQSSPDYQQLAVFAPHHAVNHGESTKTSYETGFCLGQYTDDFHGLNTHFAVTALIWHPFADASGPILSNSFHSVA
jgi:hypothetical protein